MATMIDPRRRMVRRQIAGRGIADRRVLAAMETVPREAFLPEAMQEFAYEDTPLPIEEGQTISQPYIVARMAEAADVGPGDRVLEVGAGSGYAAAVLGELAGRVFTIERHPALADLARARLRQLGYDNVEVLTGDGTLGWPEQAPFDAIIATAGGPRVPDTWRAQLAVGGRLVMPVGETPTIQRLIRLTRTSAETWHEEQIEEVRFVPLIGEQGWPEEEPKWPEEEPKRRQRQRPPSGLPQLIRAGAQPLPNLDDAAFAAAFDRYADRKVVLLGEATHGTSEFYRARAAITQRLIDKHGFSFVAVEADWPDAFSIDRYVRHRPARPGARPAFRRFPTWMWRNTDVEAFMEWLRGHNEVLPADRRAGFFGLDIYSMADSIDAVLAYLDKVDPEAAKIARERYGCLTPWQHDPAVYGRAVLSERYRACEADIVAALGDLLAKRLEYARDDGEQFFDATQNARLVAVAERYYRSMYYGSAESWNLRDRHMFETLQQLLAHRGDGAKAVVWAHNSHIGDARFTDMGRVRGELNLGELCRGRFGGEAALIGFGTHSGTVAAASDWGGPMEVKEVRPSREGSIEGQFHIAGLPRSVLHLDLPGELRRRLREPRLERFIGVIYRPETELQSHYAEVELPGQFDAYVWFDRTSAVTALPTAERRDAPETWPFGL
jgi:protein-L-isoaspartate(D-aspartate) O-methyltransferase